MHKKPIRCTTKPAKTCHVSGPESNTCILTHHFNIETSGFEQLLAHFENFPPNLESLHQTLINSSISPFPCSPIAIVGGSIEVIPQFCLLIWSFNGFAINGIQLLSLAVYPLDLWFFSFNCVELVIFFGVWLFIFDNFHVSLWIFFLKCHCTPLVEFVMWKPRLMIINC